jgi:hypothetical protein
MFPSDGYDQPPIFIIYSIKIVSCLIKTCPTTCIFAFIHVLTTLWVCVMKQRLTHSYPIGLARNPDLMHPYLQLETKLT